MKATTAVLSDAELERKFEALKEQWINETRFLSIAAQKIAHPAYLKLIKLGDAALPLLLRELKRRPDFWFAALEAIAEDNPVPPEHLGDLGAMTKDWIEWGRVRGYVP